jgi:hypothetical protein
MSTAVMSSSSSSSSSSVAPKPGPVEFSYIAARADHKTIKELGRAMKLRQDQEVKSLKRKHTEERAEYKKLYEVDKAHLREVKRAAIKRTRAETAVDADIEPEPVVTGRRVRFAPVDETTSLAGPALLTSSLPPLDPRLHSAFYRVVPSPIRMASILAEFRSSAPLVRDLLDTIDAAPSV